MSINITRGDFAANHVAAAPRPATHGARFVAAVALLALLAIATVAILQESARSDEPAPADMSDVMQGP